MSQHVGIILLITTFPLYCSASPEAAAPDVETVVLGRAKECQADLAVLQQLCGLQTSDLESNWAVLDCIDNLPAEKQLSADCENKVWNFKVEITKKDYLLKQAQEFCPNDDIAKQCDHENESEPGFLLACLVGRKHETKNLQCSKFLAQVESIIFSDYRIISGFLTACQADVDNLNCGRSRGIEGQKHSQGATIQCLSDQMAKVQSEQCRQEIQAMVEIQGDDFHLDRTLFLACREDKEKFCQRVASGEGRVYQCLMKYRQSVSQQCQAQLSRRQKLRAEDFKADGGLVKSCKADIKKYSCRREVEKESKHAVKLSQILLCLESHIRDGEEVAGECRAELGEIRREMMEDYSVSPELVANCATEIEDHCADSKKRQGGAIHCLMKLITEGEKEKVVGQKCEAAVELLLRQSEVMSDWQADPVLEDACDEVVVAACDPKQGGEAVMSCLMEQLSQGGNAMTTECSQVLMQIHYFLAREVIIDDHLYRACNKDAVRVCGGAQNWHRNIKEQKNLLVFPCLVRNLYIEDDEDELEDEKDPPEDPSQLSDECVEEVERTLRQRAMSVNLHPQIEEDCRDFLHTFCTAHVKPGEELSCLQEHFSSLQAECRETVKEFTQIEARNPYLHPVISKACSNLIDKKCGLEAKAQDGSGVMECLVRHKIDHPAGSRGAMNSKCRTVVEQWQILTMQDWRFSFKFKTACKNDIRDHCRDPRPTKKQDVIQCLVEAVATDTVESEKHRISKDCRAELKFEMLQKHSNIKLDPALEAACHDDLQKFCEAHQDEDGGIECLKGQKHKDLTKTCRKQLFKEEKEEANMNEVDFVLTRGCKREIKEHCMSVSSRNILKCLKDFSHDNNFDQKCLNIINKRIVQQSRDYRLNPSLEKSCKEDIAKFCYKVIQKNNDVEFLEGQVVDCLRRTALQKEKLSVSCMKEVMVTVEDAAKLVAADPLLEDLCPRSLQTCRARHHQSDTAINECLKEMFKEGSILDSDGHDCNKHIAQTIEVVGADIHGDPVLHSACSVDLVKFCRDVPPGEGRIFSCLVAASKEKNLYLEPECHKILRERMEMFGKAVKVAPIDSAQALYDSVLKSPHRNFLLSFVSFFIGVIFMFGICFGRVTKRLRTELKNK